MECFVWDRFSRYDFLLCVRHGEQLPHVSWQQKGKTWSLIGSLSGLAGRLVLAEYYGKKLTEVNYAVNCYHMEAGRLETQFSRSTPHQNPSLTHKPPVLRCKPCEGRSGLQFMGECQSSISACQWGRAGCEVCQKKAVQGNALKVLP